MERIGLLIYSVLKVFVMTSYEPPTLNELILRSDIIVEGRITCVDERVIEVEVYKTFHCDSTSITVQKFREWNCGKRWFDYEIGQRSLFFLREEDERLFSLGGGNEGEMPVHENTVYVCSSTLSKTGLTDHFDLSARNMEDLGYNNPYNGYALDLEKMWEAVNAIKRCAKSDFSPTGELEKLEFQCSSMEMRSLKQKNDIFRWAIK